LLCDVGMVHRIRRALIIVAASFVLYYLWRLSGPDSGGDRDKEESGSRNILTEQEAAPNGGARVLLPKVQHHFDGFVGPQQDRLTAVKAAFEHSWHGYKTRAWLKDELAPASGGFRTTFSGFGATLIDSLDTLWIMGMVNEFEQAVEAIKAIDFDTPDGLPMNVFETTIRYLGGLLGAYDVSSGQYQVLLQKATEVGEMLLGAFDTPSKMPVLHWHKTGVEPAPGDAIMSELGSLSLEFIRLSQLTGNGKYEAAIQRITDCIHRQQMLTVMPGSLPTTVNARECDFSQGMEFSVGAHIDSAYEYMIKTHQLLEGSSGQYSEMYLRAVEPIKQHLLFKPMTETNADILLSGSMKTYYRNTQFEFAPQMQHLSCFAGGMFALGSKIFSRPQDLETARKLVDGCIWASNMTPTGIMPEMFHALPCTGRGECKWDEHAWGLGMIQKNSFDEKPADRQLPMDERLKLKAERLRMPKGVTALSSREYKLRPEAIESVFILYRITGDERLRDEAWNMFQAIITQTRTEYGYSTIEDVTKLGSRKLDKMESYWTAETLKYFYLIFSDPGLISLDEWVFNTEAHPFRLNNSLR
jgi:mannosyl-oligosaccharide alpha-1,2-mannosidase